MAWSKSTFCAALFLVFISFCCCPAASADSVFSNFGPGQSYNTGTAWVVGIVDEGQSGVFAASFVPSETATLTDVLAALGGQGSVNFYVESDSGGQPGTILDTLTTTETIGIFSAILEYTCSSCSVLTGGTTYFLVAVSPGGLYSNWNVSNSDFATAYVNGTGSATGPWTPETSTSDPLPAFEVDGTPLAPMPEPASRSLMLMGAGLVGLMMILRKH